MKKILSYILTILMAALVLASLAASVYAVGYRRGRKAAIPPVKAVTDTLVLRDTIRLEKPVQTESRTVDTLLVAVTDTLRLRDTLYLPLPREEKTYSDSATYKLVVSGYGPCLEMIETYPQTTVVREVQTVHVPSMKRWGIGIQAGYGVSVDNRQIRLSPYVGLGVSYNFIRW